MKLKSLHNEKGIAFILVVWMLVLLIALGTEFAFSMRTEVNTTRNFKEDTEAYYLARAGVALAMAEILKPALYHSYTEQAGFIVGQPAPGVTGGPGTAGNPQTAQSGQAAPEPVTEEIVREDIPLGAGSIDYSIRDENGKLSINRASREMLIKALEANGLEAGSERDGIADSILDWIDADDNHRLNGAESDYYQSRFPPYRAKNGPVESLDELLRVKGVTEELLYGSEDFDEAADKTGLHPGLIRLFTTFNTPYFNPNTAPAEVLNAVYPPEKVQEILTAKETQGYHSLTLSSHFRVQATGRMEGSPTRHTVVAVIEKIGNDNNAKLLVRYWQDNHFLR